MRFKLRFLSLIWHLYIGDMFITNLSQFNSSFPIQVHSKRFVESEQARAIERWICILVLTDWNTKKMNQPSLLLLKEYL